MSTYSEFFEENEVFTEDADGHFLVGAASIKASGFEYFTKLSIVEDTAMAIFIFSLGIVLNSIILRCYWKNKDATSIYFRAFAFIDLWCLLLILIRRSVSFFFADNIISYAVLSALTNMAAALYNLGPMFLAMDRCLIVAFPHNFREHEKKLRVAKGSMVVVVEMLSLTWAMLDGFGDPASTLAVVVQLSAGLVSLLQIIAIVVLYAIIVFKVLMSDRKMKNSRHFGNK